MQTGLDQGEKIEERKTQGYWGLQFLQALLQALLPRSFNSSNTTAPSSGARQDSMAPAARDDLKANAESDLMKATIRREIEQIIDEMKQCPVTATEMVLNQARTMLEVQLQDPALESLFSGPVRELFCLKKLRQALGDTKPVYSKDMGHNEWITVFVMKNNISVGGLLAAKRINVKNQHRLPRVMADSLNSRHQFDMVTWLGNPEEFPAELSGWIGNGGGKAQPSRVTVEDTHECLGDQMFMEELRQPLEQGYEFLKWLYNYDEFEPFRTEVKRYQDAKGAPLNNSRRPQEPVRALPKNDKDDSASKRRRFFKRASELVDGAFADENLSDPVAIPSQDDYLHVVLKRGISIGLAQSMEAVGEDRIVRAYQESGPLQQRVLQYIKGLYPKGKSEGGQS
ncbi:uncharacterized protein PG986_009278 [Apiospora aurea]|uniref:Uncharacterized protein n=1 Tax=Apiospora aurea TaxID=335848 RepID=A0ABR1Q784_9PEZI